MKTILIDGKKPIMKFDCGLCKTVWTDNEYAIKEKTDGFGMYLFASSTAKEYPVSVCPICKMTSYSSVVYNALEVDNPVSGKD